MTRIRRWTVPALAATALIGSLALTGPAAATSPPDAGPGTTAAAGDLTDAAGLADTVEAGDTDRTVDDSPEARAAAPRITRAEEIRRARLWLTADNGKPVPYSQHRNWKDGYRQDCSGFVSMALGLPKPGANTVALKNKGWTRPIKMSELRRGDLVIKAGSNDPNHRHVVIFDKWESGKRSYLSYEQAGRVGTRHAKHAYGLKAGDGYRAYRPVNLTD
ncbi:NlpC/P60 family protein [Kitasatospora sp. NPDC056327]|uniref:NlpC/P60 family protein n=1 Tax=Kitasatospora sp. NPDC056327 TaxID=3345785 RepID=UPI0035D65582